MKSFVFVYKVVKDVIAVVFWQNNAMQIYLDKLLPWDMVPYLTDFADQFPVVCLLISQQTESNKLFLGVIIFEKYFEEGLLLLKEIFNK